MADRTALIGHWEKVSFSPCSRVYPTQIEFQENGLYKGIGAQAGSSPGWDVGTYEIISPSQVRISVNNDAIFTYQFLIIGGKLKFVDPNGCEFQFEKDGCWGEVWRFSGFSFLWTWFSNS
ncbi:MAG: hypothetical protein AB4372_34255 [Xenococcus sp. (in: cyanobacteria)]